MLAASRISAASLKVIQSAGDAIGQSVVDLDFEDTAAFESFDDSDDLDDPPLSPLVSGVLDASEEPFDVDPSVLLELDPPLALESLALELPLESPPEPEPSPATFDVPGLAVARRSFFAQPDPLKWIAGVAKAFLIGPPPQSGHSVGGSAWTPRRTSNRWPQFAQS